MEIDISLRKSLERLAANWDLPIEQVALRLAEDEISNRVQKYPEVQNILADSSFDLQQFAVAARRCWVMTGQIDAIRFNEYISKGNESAAAIQILIKNFPPDDSDASRRIQDFLATTTALGFSTPTRTRDWAGAALLASLILTAMYPQRFVDYRQGRWQRFAETLGQEHPTSTAQHSVWIIWAGRFAQDLSQTETYKKLWPNSDPRLSWPLWVIGGICWTGLSPDKPLPDPIDPDMLWFPEGFEKRRLHFIHERNRALVSNAKSIGRERDPLLRCEVCSFSFTDRYGSLGTGFIEAHHKRPVATLRAGSRTHVEDIALVCANCHRMLHAGDRTLSIEELKALLQPAFGLR